MTAHGNIVHCGGWYADEAEAAAHEAGCGECADVVDTLEGELVIVSEAPVWTLSDLAGIDQ